MSRIRVVLTNSSLARYPEAGGLWTLFLQYPLGLAALGHDVLWLELYQMCGQTARDQQLIDQFFSRMREYGLERHCAVLAFERKPRPLTLDVCTIHGRTHLELKEIISSADLLWNLAGTLKQPLLSLFKRRALIDGDPGHLQISGLECDIGQRDHDIFLTVGTKIQDKDCAVPTLGLAWHPFPQFVYLPMWKPEPDPGPHAPFTSVTQWNWEELWHDNRSLSLSKRDAYLRYVELPGRAHRPFELAANIHPQDDTGDRETLAAQGWRLVDPHKVASSPAAYQDYIRNSRAEICCPKPIYRELNTGWISDRSACYLASGRPVLAEETGFSDHFPTGKGLVTFRDLDEAVAGVAEIDSNYAQHSLAAREFAEQFLDSGNCLPAMLAACQ
jgi:hypothetical protein